MIHDFHLLRPAWLALLIPAAFLWWLLKRRTDASQSWRGIVAPHLLPHLLTGEQKHSRVGPLEWVALGWLIATIAITGPTWRHESAPFADDTAALAIVIKISPSMKTEDVQPSRLTRAAEKIHDLLKQRAGAKASLIAYAGTAHVVMPLTTDGGIIDTFAQALDPKIMPQDGDAAADALRLADRSLADAGAGSILWITDNIAPEQAPPLAAWRKTSRTPVRLLPPLLAGPELDAVSASARVTDANVTRLTSDDADVHTLARAAQYSTAATGAASSDRWQESGYWLTPLLAVLMLLFFRRGWMVSIGAR